MKRTVTYAVIMIASAMVCKVTGMDGTGGGQLEGKPGLRLLLSAFPAGEVRSRYAALFTLVADLYRDNTPSDEWEIAQTCSALAVTCLGEDDVAELSSFTHDTRVLHEGCLPSLKVKIIQDVIGKTDAGGAYNRDQHTVLEAMSLVLPPANAWVMRRQGAGEEEIIARSWFRDRQRVRLKKGVQRWYEGESDRNSADERLFGEGV